MTNLLASTKWLVITIASIMLLAGCGPKPPQAPAGGEKPIDVAPHIDKIINATPAPKSAAEGVNLWEQMFGFQAKIQEQKAKYEAEIGRANQKASTADKAVGVIAFAAKLAFLCVIPAYFFGGWRSAIIVMIVATGLAFAPTIIGEAWIALRPIVIIALGIGVFGLMGYYAVRLVWWIEVQWTAHKQASKGLVTQAAALVAAERPHVYRSGFKLHDLVKKLEAKVKPT